MKKIEDVILFDKHKDQNGEVILLDVKNTFKNIFDMLKKKHPNIKIELVNE